MATRFRLAPWLGTMEAAAQAGLPVLTPDPTKPANVYGIPASVMGAQTIEEATVAAKQSIAQTGGLPIVYSTAVQTKPSWLDALKSVALGVVSFTNPAGAAKLGLSAVAPTDNMIAPQKFVGFAGGPGGTTMGLFDDIWGGLQNVATTVFPTNQGIDWNNILNQGIGLATTALAPRGVSQGFAPPTAQPAMMAAAPAIARAGAVVGRGFFNRFPNLATAIQQLRNTGMNVTRSKLYGVMKRFGPEFLVTGGLLTAAAVNELAVAGPGYRRMNPANVRALRRSVRRIESFHKLCATTDRLRGRSRRKKC